MMRKLFVDDYRLPPDITWELAKTYDEAIRLLDQNQYDMLALDHDLEDIHYSADWNKYYNDLIENEEVLIKAEEIEIEKTGYDIICWLEVRKANGLYVPPVITCHSANPAGRARILQVIDKLKANT